MLITYYAATAAAPRKEIQLAKRKERKWSWKGSSCIKLAA